LPVLGTQRPLLILRRWIFGSPKAEFLTELNHHTHGRMFIFSSVLVGWLISFHYNSNTSRSVAYKLGSQGTRLYGRQEQEIFIFFQASPTGSGTQPSSHSMGAGGYSPGGKSGQGVRLTTDLNPVGRLRKRRSVSPQTFTA